MIAPWNVKQVRGYGLVVMGNMLFAVIQLVSDRPALAQNYVGILDVGQIRSGPGIYLILHDMFLVAPLSRRKRRYPIRLWRNDILLNVSVSRMKYALFNDTFRG